MSVEAWAAVAQIGTFVVIAVTAIATLIQLNHLRSANLINATNSFLDEYEGSENRDAFSFVRTQLKHKLEDPEFCKDFQSRELDRAKHPEVAVLNFFDKWGGYYRQGAIDRPMFMRLNANLVLSFWQQLEPVVAMFAKQDGSNLSFEQFEYLAVQAQDWSAVHPRGDYPKGVRRMSLTNGLTGEDRNR